MLDTKLEFKYNEICSYIKSNQMKAPSASMWTTDGSAMIPLEQIEVDAPKTTPFERRFNPYDFNGGYAKYLLCY